MSDEVTVASEDVLHALLASLARARRMVFFSGLPGVGKSLLIRELALAASRAGRAVHLLQWDVVRPAFVTPAIAARYPDRNGEAHPMVRKAVGRWARDAVLRWHREHDAAHILIGEVPLVGARLLDLVQVQADEAEPLLAGDGVLFVTPVPSIAVRTAIEIARGRSFSNPAHPREGEDAPPDLMQAIWEDVRRLAVRIGAAVPAVEARATFDPRAYAAVYEHLLRHRRSLTLSIDADLSPRGSVYDLDIAANELAPTADEATAIVERLEREYSMRELEAEVAGWFE